MKLYAVGLGPGNASEITPRALEAIRKSDVVAGYTLYLEQLGSLIAGKERIETPMKGETERCRAAIGAALAGKTVAVVSGGDAGVYGMAGLLHELAAEHPGLSIEVIPGVTAACSAAAVLGAPLSHDFAVISLSDLLTDWSVIEKRLRLAAQADFIICIYNPASKKRGDYLKKACRIILENAPPDTPCGVARNVGRDGENTEIMPLSELKDFSADMFCTVIIGNSSTKIINGKLVTPRGYLL